MGANAVGREAVQWGIMDQAIAAVVGGEDLRGGIVLGRTVWKAGEMTEGAGWDDGWAAWRIRMREHASIWQRGYWVVTHGGIEDGIVELP